MRDTWFALIPLAAMLAACGMPPLQPQPSSLPIPLDWFDSETVTRHLQGRGMLEGRMRLEPGGEGTLRLMGVLSQGATLVGRIEAPIERGEAILRFQGLEPGTYRLRAGLCGLGGCADDEITVAWDEVEIGARECVSREIALPSGRLGLGIVVEDGRTLMTPPRPGVVLVSSQGRPSAGAAALIDDEERMILEPRALLATQRGHYTAFLRRPDASGAFLGRSDWHWKPAEQGGGSFSVMVAGRVRVFFLDSAFRVIAMEDPGEGEEASDPIMIDPERLPDSGSTARRFFFLDHRRQVLEMAWALEGEEGLEEAVFPLGALGTLVIQRH